ncbi:MAG: DNA gyrase/topoisomerase IV subunit A, partial [Candidatus Acidiferrales bacterium]
MADEQSQQILTPVDIESEMKKSYLDYAMSVIIGRALPDVRDGLKPVHRRILYAMHEMGLTPGKRYSKCAGVVGEVLKKFHPHGDVPVYDALVRLVQTFNQRYPLIDGQGNFGSVDGDPPAAYRYTECRLAPIAMEMLADIEKDTVNFVPNFDESTGEPTVLPTRIPCLLVNGSSGIAVGMATNIPPHNLKEIIEATVMLIEDPETNLKKVMKLVPGPDFPTGGYIYGRDGIEQAYKTGRGTFQVRAKAAIEQAGKERENIVITELPYQVNKSRLISHIADLVQNKKIQGISDIRDESDRDGMRIVIEVKRDEEPQLILNHLFKQTQMQESFGMILLAIVAGQPRELGLVELIKLFIEHRVEVVRRRTQYDLRKAEEREHILVGFKIALDHLDEIIKLIRRSKSPKEAKEALMAMDVRGAHQPYEDTRRSAAAGFTDRQAQAILDLQLHRLTQMEREKILAELKEIQARIAELKEILASDKKLRAVIVAELKEIVKDYG